MATTLDGIDESLAAWLGAQPVFFVATAPRSDDQLINCSPKGIAGTFTVLDEHTVAYLDLTGSGVETIAHLRENGRIVLDGDPQKLRGHQDIQEFYLGTGAGSRKSYRDVKQYRRSRRWYG